MAINWMDILGGGLGLGGSIFNANQNRQTSNQYFGMGAPYRERLRAISDNPNLYYDSPEARALADASDRRYSAAVGNPAGSGTAQAGALEAMMRGYGNERDRLYNYGGLGYFNQAAPGARQGQMGANMGVLGGLGGMLGILGNQNWGSLFGGGGMGGGAGAWGEGGGDGGWGDWGSYYDPSETGDWF